MFINLQPYFYFIGVTLIVPLWVLLFIRKDKRKDMLLVGVLSGIAAIILDKYYATVDYWHPISIINWLPFDDFYYGFIYGGVAAELYEFIFKKKNSPKPTKRSYASLLYLFIFGLIASFLVMVNIFHLNSITAHIVPPLAFGCIIPLLRKDLFIPELISGFIITILTYCMFLILILIYPEIFANHWELSKLSGIYITGIPIEELLFAFSVGFLTGNAYEFLYGYSLVPANQVKS